MNAASAAHPPVDAESKADPVRMDFPVDSPGGPPPATANRFTGAPCTPPAHHPHTTPHTKATRSYAYLRRETEEGRAEDGLDFRVVRMPPHPKVHPHTSPQFWICGGSERRLPGPDQEGSITLAAALRTTSRSGVECCSRLGNSCEHGCGYDVAAVMRMYGVVSSRLP